MRCTLSATAGVCDDSPHSGVMMDWRRNMAGSAPRVTSSHHSCDRLRHGRSADVRMGPFVGTTPQAT